MFLESEFMDPTNVGTVTLAVSTNEYFNCSSKQEGADV